MENNEASVDFLELKEIRENIDAIISSHADGNIDRAEMIAQICLLTFVLTVDPDTDTLH